MNVCHFYARPLLPLAACIITAMLNACGSGSEQGTAMEDPRTQSPASFMAQQLSELDSLPLPEGIDQAQWEGLKQAMRSQLADAKAVLAAPVTPASAAKLSLDEASLTLAWGYACQGDYDQNSEVNIADLAPLGSGFGASTNGLGPFPPGSVESMVDGDSNGELNIADLSPIGSNFGRRVEKFNVYRTLSIADLPAGNADPVGSGAELLSSVAHADATGSPSQGQLRFSFVLDNAAPGWFYFVRPADGNTEGTPSNLTSFGAKPDNLSPIASFTADPASGDAPLSVSFDASASSDPDGANGDITDIVQFLWDFDGDGIVDETTSDPTTQHSYLQPGQFQATLLIFDAGAGSDLSSVAISVGQAGNTPPVAALSADTLSGQAPLLVSFDASSSTDDGGSAGLSFEWDFDGDGNFDLNTGNIATAQTTYQNGGQFDARVLVTDSGGLSATAAVSLDIAAPADNLPPLAVVNASVTSGQAPLEVNFNFLGSSDPDGSITEIAMDFDGDGTVDFTSTSLLSSVSFTYVDGGIFQALLTVTDDRGATASDSKEISAFDPDNQFPDVQASVSPLTGNTPLEVTLDASASSDPDGVIEQYQWDIDGDFIFDIITTEPVSQHVFEDAGSFSIALRCIDDDGAVSTGVFGTVAVEDPANQPPQAAFSFSQTGSSFPQEFTFDASGSTDPDGSIVSYRLDLDGDGTFEVNGGGNPLIVQKLFSKRTVIPALQVTDNDGATATAVGTELTVTAGWDLFTLGGIADNNGATSAAVISHGLAGKQRTFVVAYSGNDNNSPVNFVSSSTTTIDFGTPVIPDGASGPGALSVIEANDVPLLVFLSSAFNISGIRANDADGDSWGSTFTIEEQSCDFLATALIGGVPAVGFALDDKLRFEKALDADGLDWSSTAVLARDFSGDVEALGFAQVGNIPAFWVQSGSQKRLSYLRAQNIDGTIWPLDDIILNNNLVNSAFHYGAVILNGNPAIAVSQLGGLTLRRSADNNGDSWPDGAVIDTFAAARTNINLGILSTGPVVSYREGGVFKDMVVVFADAVDGSSWGEVQFVDTAGDVGLASSMVVSGNRVLVTYIDATNGNAKAAFINH
ncbi:PKD domain-containing protein [bacterium]|nr:PKD domain-containing protein [bacterium]